MGLNNLYDQSVPVLDTWVVYDSTGRDRLFIDGVPKTTYNPGHTIKTYAGYSISCYPSHQLLGVTPAIAQGRNIYAQIATMMRDACVGAGVPCRAGMYVTQDARKAWQVSIGIVPTSSVFPDSIELDIPTPFDNGEGPTSWMSVRWLGFDTQNGSFTRIKFIREVHPEGGDGYWATTVSSPIGLWQPEHMGWTTRSDRAVNYRVAASPFSQRFETRLNWGEIDTKELRYEMVHAADVFRDRNADIPCDGWAAAAHTTPLNRSTLERLLPWWTRATPQGKMTTNNPRYNSLWHRDGAQEDIEFDPASIPGLVAWFPVRSAINNDPGQEGMFSEVSSIAGSHPGLKMVMGAPAHRGYAGWQRTSMTQILGLTAMNQISVYCNSPSADSFDVGYEPTVADIQYTSAPSNRSAAYMSSAGLNIISFPEVLSVSDPFTSEPAPNNILFSDYIAFERTNGDQSASLDRKLYMRGRTVNKSSADVFNWSTQNMQIFFPDMDKNRTIYDGQMTHGDVFIFNRHLTDEEHNKLMAWLYEYAYLNYGDS